MSWKCKFGHKWKLASNNQCSYYEEGAKAKGELPIRIDTMLLYRCERCDEFRESKLEGSYPSYFENKEKKE